MECGQFGEDIADEDLDLRAEEDAGGVVAEPEGAGAEFVVGLERVAFFGVHALDFDVEVQGFTWRVASGEWRVASGEWRVASGEWRVASGAGRSRE